MNKTTPTPAQSPFESDSSYMDAEIQWLTTRTRRIGLQHRLAADDDPMPAWNCMTVGAAETVLTEEARRRLDRLREEEQRLRLALDARLEIHRRDANRPQLGLDQVCQANDLDPRERLVLLVCTAVAVSSRVAEAITRPIGGAGFGGGDVDAMMALLDCATVADCMRMRRLFGRQGSLLRGNLIVIEHLTESANPGDLLSASVQITGRVFDVITGQPDPDDDEGALTADAPGRVRGRS